jgi:hypothetical protein
MADADSFSLSMCTAYARRLRAHLVVRWDEAVLNVVGREERERFANTID